MDDDDELLSYTVTPKLPLKATVIFDLYLNFLPKDSLDHQFNVVSNFI